MNLYFIDSYDNQKFLIKSDEKDVIFAKIREFLSEHHFKSYYMRMWLTQNGNTMIDFGSHTEFFIVDCDIMSKSGE